MRNPSKGWALGPISREGGRLPEPAYIVGRGSAHLCSLGRIARNLDLVVGRPESTNEPNSFSKQSMAVEQQAVDARRDCDGGFSLKIRFSSPEPAKPGRFLVVWAPQGNFVLRWRASVKSSTNYLLWPWYHSQCEKHHGSQIQTKYRQGTLSVSKISKSTKCWSQ
jgi:hypothetical protein